MKQYTAIFKAEQLTETRNIHCSEISWTEEAEIVPNDAAPIKGDVYSVINLPGKVVDSRQDMHTLL